MRELIMADYKLRIVVYKQMRYYQFIPESIYEYINGLPMWKFLENVKNGKALENMCFLIGSANNLSETY